ncbi:hypothetical protein Tco_0287580 [Tanacetum coccineum]
MVRSKCVSTKQQSQQQVNPDDEGGDDLNIADDVTQQSIVVMEKPRKKRGINKVKDLPVGESVRFNKLGAAIGEYQRTFTSYCGNTVRSNISILKPNWHKIDEEEKELLWQDIKGKMRLEDDDTIKSYTLKSCGQKWRAFKNTLRNDYMLKKRCPRGTYTFLEPSVWKDFCRNEHYTEEKRVKGVHGERMIEMTNKGKTDLHKIPGRGSNFCLGRRRLDKDGNLTVPPEIVDINNYKLGDRDMTKGSSSTCPMMSTKEMSPSKTQAIET